jgi:hypothetical protein
MKKILQEEKKEREDQENKMNSKVELVSSRSFYTNSIPARYSEIIANEYFIPNGSPEIKMPRSVFHPPSSF